MIADHTIKEEDARMARGGRRKDRNCGPERRCIASGDSGPTDRMIRFVLSPDRVVTPDLAARLPGRGVWVTAERELIDKVAKRGLFSRGFKQAVKSPDDMADLLERLLTQRLIGTISMARKAGVAVTGFDTVETKLRGKGDVILVTASDSAEDGRKKLEKLAPDRPKIGVLVSDELGLAFGRDFAIHAALDAGGIADRALMDAARLAGFRKHVDKDCRTQQVSVPASK